MIILLVRFFISKLSDAWMPERRKADHDIYRQAASEKGVFKSEGKRFLLLLSSIASGNGMR